MSKRDYSKGQIYKLCCLDPNVKEIYVGSTINFKNRKSTHKSKSKKEDIKVYQYIRDNGGWNNWNMIWIKDYPCKTKRELEAEENRVMCELKSTLNSQKAIHNCKEWNKINYEKNKKKINKRNIIRYHKTKQENKGKIKKYASDTYEKRKEKLLEKKICECGSSISLINIKRHKETKKHLKFIENSFP